MFSSPAEMRAYLRSERAFRSAHAANLVVISAQTATGWAPNIPDGFVGCTATLGHANHVGVPQKHYLVSRAEYRTRSPHGFIIDPSRHIETDDQFIPLGPTVADSI